MSDPRPVLFHLGVFLTLLAPVALLPALADLAIGAPTWRAFIGAAGAALFIGVSLILSQRAGEGARLTPREAHILALACWIAAALLGALPFLFADIGLGFAEAIFEAMSGITATASTTIGGLEKLPPSILLWRGLLQWLGGIGIIVTALALLPSLRPGGPASSRFDGEAGARPSAETIGTTTLAYVFLTLLCAGAYWLAGMTGFDAVVHAMTTLSTGGFSNYDDQLGHYDHAAIIATPFMLIGGMSFILIARALRGDAAPLWRDAQIRAYLGLASALSIGLGLWLWLANGEDPGRALRQASFAVASILSTTGLVEADWSQWGALPVAVIFLLTFVGGCSGSAAGGVKIFRFQILFALARAQLRHAVDPRAPIAPRLAGEALTDAAIHGTTAFLLLYAASVILLSLALAITGLDLPTSLGAAAGAIGNGGRGWGEIVGPAGNYATLPEAAKWLLSFGMLLGRLEILALLAPLAGLARRGSPEKAEIRPARRRKSR